MSFESSPSESQKTDAAPRDSISGKVSSLIAATTTSYPCARAASSTRNGKRPLPAMRPSLGCRSTKKNKLELINVLLKRFVGEMAISQQSVRSMARHNQDGIVSGFPTSASLTKGGGLTVG